MNKEFKNYFKKNMVNGCKIYIAVAALLVSIAVRLVGEFSLYLIFIKMAVIAIPSYAAVYVIFVKCIDLFERRKAADL